MADWSIASQVRAQTPQDVISPLSAIANIQLAQQRAKEVGLQADLQSARLGARNALQSYVDQGTPLEQALVKSGYPAFDPAGAQQLMAASQKQREQAAFDKWGSNTGNIGALASAGPTFVKAGQDIIDAQQKQRIDRQNAVGNIAAGFLANPSEQARQLAISQAKAIGGLSELEATQLSKLPLDQFGAIAKNYAGAGAQSIATSGQEEYNKGLAKAATLTEKVSPGETVLAAPAAEKAMRGANAPAAQAPAIYQRGASVADGMSPQGLSRMAQIESGSRADAVNGHAAGLMQFMPATWRQYGTGSPFDPNAATEAAQRYAADNKPLLARTLGRAPTDAELYLAHQQGGQGAANLLANPTAKASDIVGARAVIANGGRLDMTAKQFADMWINKFNGSKGATGSFDLSGARPGGPAMAMPPEMAQALAASIAAPVAPAAMPIAPVAGQSPQTLQQPGLAPAPQAPAPAAAPMAQQPSQAPAAAIPAQVAAAAPGVTAPTTGLAADRAAAPLRPVFQGMSLEQQALQRGMGELGVKQISEAREAYQGALSGQQNLQQLQKDLADLPSGGWLQPGSGATQRIGVAKAVNTLMEGAGYQPLFDPGKIAAAESSQKITGRLGFDLSRTLGAREAASVVHQAISLNPGVENTPQGARVILASLNAGLQRQKDFYAFQQQYTAQTGSPQGAEIAFDRARPVGQYVQDVYSLARVPPKAIQLLQSQANDPSAAVEFDQHYGPGLARYFLGSAQ